MMNLPKEKLTSSRGQILVLFLLVLVVALSIVLLVASRTVTEIRTTTTSDESNRAYFAAEAGVEEALRKLDLPSGTPGSCPSFPCTVNLSLTVTNTDVRTEVNPANTGPLFVYPDYVAKDNVAQVFLSDFNTLGSGSWGGTGTSLDFYWGASACPTSPCPPDTPAIEVSVVYVDGSNNFGIRKEVFDPAGRNNFCSGTPVIQTFPLSEYPTRTFRFTANLDLFSSVPCTGLGLTSGTDKPVLARVRLLYNSEPSPVAVVANGQDLPAQGSRIVSTGTTPSGVTRRLEVTRLYPALDPFFDYVLLSKTGLSK